MINRYDGLSPCAHFLLGMIVGRDLNIEQLREEVAPNAKQLGVATTEEWIGELQDLLNRELVIRVPSTDGCYRYRATAEGTTAWQAWWARERSEAM